jgi:GDSL-like Lipase/Acylhydrolase family
VNRTLLKNLTALTLSVLFALVVAEFAARTILRDITTTADNRSYFALKWKKANVRLNSFGYREREFNSVKTAGAFRVAFIGDSFAFGQGIGESERMSNLMEADLRQQVKGIEVLNFGNAGNNTADEVLVLQKLLSTSKPDFVFLQWYVNDVENKGLTLAGQSASVPEPSTFNQFKQSMRNMSVLYFLAAEEWHQLLERFAAGYVEDTFKRVGDPESADWQAAEHALVEFIETCRSHNIPLGVVLVPAVMPLNGNKYPYDYLHERVLTVCQREAVVCTDLLEVFRPYMDRDQDYRSLWVNRFDSHMGAYANRLAATRLVGVYGPTVTAAALSAASAH